MAGMLDLPSPNGPSDPPPTHWPRWNRTCRATLPPSPPALCHRGHGSGFPALWFLTGTPADGVEGENEVKYCEVAQHGN